MRIFQIYCVYSPLYLSCWTMVPIAGSFIHLILGLWISYFCSVSCMRPLALIFISVWQYKLYLPTSRWTSPEVKTMLISVITQQDPLPATNSNTHTVLLTRRKIIISKDYQCSSYSRLQFTFQHYFWEQILIMATYALTISYVHVTIVLSFLNQLTFTVSYCYS